MMRFRPKLGSERGPEWRCYFCFHVRTGTIFIGIVHLAVQLMAVAALASIMRDPRLYNELEQDSVAGPRWNDMGRLNNAMPTPLSNVEARHNKKNQHSGSEENSFIYVCALAITLMLIYGAARGKPAHLLPFFCVQILDFAITILTVTGYMCYLRSIHRLIVDNPHVPMRAELMQLPAPALALIVVFVCISGLLTKAYSISVVWRCYKYCTWRAATMHGLTPFVISEGIMPGPLPPYLASPSPVYSSLLPDYEEAVKQTPPPSYRAATLMAAADPTVAAIPETPPGENQSQQTAETVVILTQQGQASPGTQAVV